MTPKGVINGSLKGVRRALMSSPFFSVADRQLLAVRGAESCLAIPDRCDVGS